MDFFPAYRYCGPGKSGPGAPINQLDALCMQHDACYGKHGSSPMCDEVFLRQIEALVDPYTQMGRDAQLMRLAMKLKQML